jgi:hypothetical protein
VGVCKNQGVSHATLLHATLTSICFWHRQLSGRYPSRRAIWLPVAPECFEGLGRRMRLFLWSMVALSRWQTWEVRCVEERVASAELDFWSCNLQGVAEGRFLCDHQRNRARTLSHRRPNMITPDPILNRLASYFDSVFTRSPWRFVRNISGIA